MDAGYVLGADTEIIKYILHDTLSTMKMPSKVKRYCPHCKKYQTFEVSLGKKKKASELKWGQRRFRRVTRGYGGFPRPKPEGREKPTRRVYLKYRCTVCKHVVQPPAFRSKKFELIEVRD